MAIGVGFANDEYDEKSIEDYYEEEPKIHRIKTRYIKRDSTI